jgi:hypothetical protein
MIWLGKKASGCAFSKSIENNDPIIFFQFQLCSYMYSYSFRRNINILQSGSYVSASYIFTVVFIEIAY